MLVKQIALRTGKPFFEILEWPEDELTYWAASFSIDNNKEQPKIPLNKGRKDTDVQTEINQIRAVFAS